MKSKMLIPIIITQCVLFILLGITFCTDLLFDGKYNLLNHSTEKQIIYPETSEQVKQPKEQQDSDNNYAYTCQLEINKNKININTNIYFNEDEVKKQNCKYDKYKITCEDEQGNNHNCNDVGVSSLSFDTDYSKTMYTYFTYKINEKEYIKNYLNNSFVLNPNEYDTIKYFENEYIQFFKGDTIKTLDTYTSTFLDIGNYEFINAIPNIGLSSSFQFYFMKDNNGNGKIFRKDGKEDALSNSIKIDKIYLTEYFSRALIKSGNHIMLYTLEGELLWDFGTFENIDTIEALPFLSEVCAYELPNTMTPLSEERLNQLMTSKYVLRSSDKEIILKYNRHNKTGTIE